GNRRLYISAKQEEIISAGTVSCGSPHEEYLLNVMADLHEAYLERFKSLIADGAEHTFIKQFNYFVVGTTLKQWIREMLSKSEDWVSKSD
ncbi:MAG: vtpJ-therm, partial [Bacteroidota bacterium]